MIQTNELRIGNWIYDKDRTVIDPDDSGYRKVTEIKTDSNGLYMVHHMSAHDKHGGYSSGGNWFKNDSLQGIPLTPEWLGKCGFKITDDSGNWNYKEYTIYENKRFLIGEKENIFYCYRQVDDDYYSGMCPKLSSLHQLQNLYFALMGTELEINLG